MDRKEILTVGNEAVRMHPVFFRFLKENNAFLQWVANREFFTQKILKMRCYPYVSHSKARYFAPQDLLRSAQSSFAWKDTPQGFSFWNQLNGKYLIFLREYGNKRNPANG